MGQKAVVVKQKRTTHSRQLVSSSKVNLTKINLVFLRTNCTIVLQPLDQGFTKSLNLICHYQKQLEKFFCMDTTISVKISLFTSEFLDDG